MEPGIEVTVVPHLYDLSADGTGVLCLQGVTGDLVLFSWLYERASRWILNRNDIRGHEGQTLLKSLDDDDEGEDDIAVAEAAEAALLESGPEEEEDLRF